jgi:hypothetical protein
LGWWLLRGPRNSASIRKKYFFFKIPHLFLSKA